MGTWVLPAPFLTQIVGSGLDRDPIGVAALTAVRSERTGGFGAVDSYRPETLILSLLIS